MIAHEATAKIPIVASFGGNPVNLGLVTSINRLGGNMTGVIVLSADLEAKRLEELNELVPKDAIIGILFDPTFPDAQSQVQQFEASAAQVGGQIRIFNISSEADIDRTFAAIREQRISALAVAGNPLFFNRRVVTRLGIPAIFENREFTEAGGLMSYGTNVPEVYHQIGVYTARILKGEKAADLPVLLPTKFDIAVNLKIWVVTSA